MIEKNVSEVVHVEADNLLFGRYSRLLPVLRAGYPSLAATPLNANKSFITASILWIASLSSLKRFNDYLMNLATNTNNGWKDYLTWLRPYGCCKSGGIDPDSSGQGIKPFAINEMSMLAHYHNIRPREFQIFPVIPVHEYVPSRHICNLTSFAPGGHEVGPATLEGVWDPNSWGQFLGGTSRNHGKDPGFTDGSHIAGQAIRVSRCTVKMICSAILGSDRRKGDDCATAPQVKCGEDSTWTPLWNLHVHSKHTRKYISHSCSCVVRNNATKLN